MCTICTTKGYNCFRFPVGGFRYIKKQTYKDGHTGKVAFDNNGDRIYAEYDIVNVKEVANKDAIGKYYFDNVSKDDLL